MVIKVRNFSVRSSDLFFFDNNIWMFLFAPNRKNNYKERIFGDFLASILTLGRPIYITSMVLSEFSNAYMKYSRDNWLASQQTDSKFKKQYVGTDDHASAINELIAAKKNILSIATRFTDDFTTIDTNSICNNLKIADYNDSYYAEFCLKRNINLVTDDADLIRLDNEKLRIITS